VTVDRLARHARLYGTDGIFAAALDMIDGSELVRLAAILRRLDWRPTKAEQALIDEARTARNGDTGARALPPISEWSATSGWSPLSPHGKGVLSVTDGVSDLDPVSTGYGAQRLVTCAECGRKFRAVRSTAGYCGPTCRQRARRSAR